MLDKLEGRAEGSGCDGTAEKANSDNVCLIKQEKWKYLCTRAWYTFICSARYCSRHPCLMEPHPDKGGYRKDWWDNQVDGEAKTGIFKTSKQLLLLNRECWGVCEKDEQKDSKCQRRSWFVKLKGSIDTRRNEHQQATIKYKLKNINRQCKVRRERAKPVQGREKLRFFPTTDAKGRYLPLGLITL